MKPYAEYPKKWKNYLIVYCFQYTKSKGSLSIREFCRRKDINQATAKAWITPSARNWLIAEMVSLKFEQACDVELEEKRLIEVAELSVENKRLIQENRQLRKLFECKNRR